MRLIFADDTIYMRGDAFENIGHKCRRDKVRRWAEVLRCAYIFAVDAGHARYAAYIRARANAAGTLMSMHRQVAIIDFQLFKRHAADTVRHGTPCQQGS